MPNPPFNEPPPFIPNDLRISPSGPYLSDVPGAIIQLGADAVVSGDDSSVVILPEAADPALIPRTIAAPLAVTFPSWVSTNVLWLHWHFAGLISVNVEGAETDVAFAMVPTIDFGDGAGPQLINNAGHGGTYAITTHAGVNTSDPVTLGGVAAFRITDPANPPIVQLAYQINGLVETDNEVITAGVIAGTTVPSPFSCWLTAAELDGAHVFQLAPEVILSPLAP
jgi:hypothetical protein